MAALALFFWTSSAQAVVLSIPIASTADDAEERVSSGAVNLTSSDMEFVHDGGNEQIVGLRFQNVAVPVGATINSAFIQFQVDETDTGTTNVVINGELSADPFVFSGTPNNISTRTPTVNAQNWSIPPWNSVGDATTVQRTPDLSTIVSEQIGQAGWTSGNAMAFLFSAGAGCNSSACQRTAEAHNGGQAVLNIDYTLTGGPADADLDLVVVDSPDPAGVNQDYAYTLTLTNNGPIDATSVMLFDTPPAGATLVSVTSSLGTCVTGATISCSIGALANGDSATVIIVVQVGTPGVVTNSANATADQPDAIVGNNSSIDTTSITANVNQVCYLVADAGGSGGGNDLLTQIDTADFDPLTNETNIGTGTGTNNIEAIAWDSANSVLYAANAGQLGVLSTVSGVFSARPNTFGTGGDGGGNPVNFTDVDALSFDATAGILYGVHARGGDDVLFQINAATGAHVADAFGPGVDYVVLQSILGNNITDDIAIDPTTGVMYASINNGATSDRLVIVNKATGATTDIALISVPDIEGLGTDPTGQLWGTSGTQNILYEIDKTTGIGSFGRDIDNGSDYEAVDCFATSPTVVNDVAIAKTVDNATPSVAGTVEFTVTAANLGTGSITALQVTDALPAGLTFVAAVPSQGLYDAGTGVWFVGTLVTGGDATLLLSATVDAASPGTVLTNTASLLGMTQTDTDPDNNTAAVDVTIAGLTLAKSVTTLSDPQGNANPKAVPGAIMRYTITVSNAATVSPDGDSLQLVDALPTNVAFRVTGATPVAFSQNATPSGLTFTFGGLTDGSDDVEFSNDGGSTYTYTPTDSGNGTDPSVTHIRFLPKGTFAAASGADIPGCDFQFLVQVN